MIFFSVIRCILSAWWLKKKTLKTYESVSWDDEIPNDMEKNKHVPNHQTDWIKFDEFFLSS